MIGKFVLGLCKYFSLAILYAIGGVVLYFTLEFNPFRGDIYSILYLVGFGLSVLLSWLIAFRKKDGKKEKKKSSWKKEEDERPMSWWEKRKEKKARQLDREKEEAEEAEKRAREEEMKAQERRLEELRAERIKEEIAREERLIEEYRNQAVASTKNRYEEPAPSYSKYPQEEEISYFGAPVSQHQAPKRESFQGYGSNPYPDTRASGYTSPIYAPDQPKVEVTPKEDPKIYMSAVEEDTLIHEYSDRFEVYKLKGGEKVLSSIEYKDKR